MSVFRPRRPRAERLSDAEMDILDVLQHRGPQNSRAIVWECAHLPQRRVWTALERLTARGDVTVHEGIVRMTGSGRRRIRP